MVEQAHRLQRECWIEAAAEGQHQFKGAQRSICFNPNVGVRGPAFREQRCGRSSQGGRPWEEGCLSPRQC